MKHLSLVLGAALGAASIFIPQIAEACSCGGGPWIGASRPADGATDVPTNVIPWVERVGTPRLFDSSGNAIAVDEIRSGSSSSCSGEAELQPEAPLEPNTTYTLSVSHVFDLAGNQATNEPFITTFATFVPLTTIVKIINLLLNKFIKFNKTIYLPINAKYNKVLNFK